MSNTRATIENMHKYENMHPGTMVAISPFTGEEYSATPGDYFTATPDYCLQDSEGEDMILVRKATIYLDAASNDEIIY